jgi:tRNA-binding protein
VSGPLANDLRIGRILSAAPAEGVRSPSYALEVDLGPELGTKRSCAQLTIRYTPQELIGRLVVCVCDLEPRQIGRYLSEVLVTGVDAVDETGGVTLLAVADDAVALGTRVY